MPTIEEMSLEEVEATLAKLRDRRRTLKRSGKATERKIATLARRRERWLDRVREIDEQIEALRREAGVESAAPVRRRGRRPKAETIA
ncbi:MAG: hypothetical protein ACYDBB_23985 [Armatimonadota bacterium]